ncbi:ThuA domain-containing protein [Halodurantibacterium flavum]|uniref:ThuA domain-containing protein n=1 Tax=Halodurantibacterium flavum TaxID=1382802 RepID=A0ABW4S0P1_9RHOB
MTRSALIFWGGWDGHEPEACTQRLAAMLREDGFDVDTHSGSEILTATDLTRFDLIVPMMTQVQVAPEGLKALIAAVAAGTGLGGFHGGMGDTFRAEPHYQYMTGGQWVAHPGNFIDYRVNITRGDDPIMQGIEDFDYHSEQYYLHVDPAIEVLATTTFDGAHDPWTKGVVMPVVWKKRYGAARVFYSALGHNAAELDHPQMQTILRRGLAWAAR